MQQTQTQPANPTNAIKRDHPHAIILPEDKPATDTLKEEIKEEVNESIQDENTPVEPVLGDDGIEVGGEG